MLRILHTIEATGWKNKDSNFYTIVPNPKGYWLADSLVYSCEEGVFLFVEAYDKKEKIGKLAVLKYNGEIFSDFKIIMEQNYHLSYPYVIMLNNEYYMIPETSKNNCIELYKAVQFPYEWKKEKELLQGKFVDTTLYEDGEKVVLFSYDIENKKMLNGVVNLTNMSIEKINIIDDSNNQYRAGGNVFKVNEAYCRPVQDNKYFYGQRLFIIECSSNKVVDEIEPFNIVTNSNKKFKRLHTYSKSGDFEAIDLSGFRFNLFKFLKKIKKDNNK